METGDGPSPELQPASAAAPPSPEPTGGGSSLYALAESVVQKVKTAAEAHNERLSKDQLMARKNQIEKVAAQLRSLAASLKVLPEAVVSGLDLEAANDLCARVQKLSKDHKAKPSAIGAPNAFGNEHDGFVDELSASATERWSAYVLAGAEEGASEDAALVAMIPPLASKIQKIATLREQLAEKAGALPATAEEVNVVLAAKASLETETQDFEEVAGLDEEVSDFLEKARIEGFSLAKLLRLDPEHGLRKWLEDNDCKFADYFRVTIGGRKA